jgi:hypothetical protein
VVLVPSCGRRQVAASGQWVGCSMVVLWGVPAGWRPGGVAAWQAGRQPYGPAGWGPSGARAWRSGGQAAAHLFFQCIVKWRSLPQARGSGC